MKDIICLFLVFTLLGCIGTSEVDKSTGEGYFPRVSGLDLTGEKHVLPDDFKTEKMVLIVAYLHEQQPDVDLWFPHIESLMKEHKSLEYFEVPTIAKLMAPIRSVIYNGMRGGIKTEFMRQHVVTLHLEKEDFNKHLGITDENQIYVYLLEKDGRILQRWDGMYSEEKFKQLKELALKE